LVQAIGSGSEGAQTTLQERYNSSLTLEEAETMAMECLKQVCSLCYIFFKLFICFEGDGGER
jgi:20S proteasome alpha/beta subunit